MTLARTTVFLPQPQLKRQTAPTNPFLFRLPFLLSYFLRTRFESGAISRFTGLTVLSSFLDFIVAILAELPYGL